jgi:2-dehydro-3-deoxygluconokinase
MGRNDMTLFTLRSAEHCRFDAVCLGEVMLRLDPGNGRVRTTRQFQVWEGGGEYNVTRGLRRCFDLRTAVVTAFADNEVGRLAEDLILTGGVDTSLIQWVGYDGIGRTVRNGLNFTERGFGVRGAVGVSDRGNTAASQLRKGDIDWDHIFGTLTAGSGPVAGRGADQKTRPRGQAAVKRKPGTASAGQTGTVAPQGGTIDRVLTKAP